MIINWLTQAQSSNFQQFDIENQTPERAKWQKSFMNPAWIENLCMVALCLGLYIFSYLTLVKPLKSLHFHMMLYYLVLEL
jgi:hypothetical protein